MSRLWFTVPLKEEGRRPWIVLICITTLRSETVPETCQHNFNFQGPQAQFRSSISSWLLWFLCKIILHLRIYFLTPLCTHTPPSTIYNFSPPLRTSKKCIIIDSPTSTYSGWYVVHYWLQDERFFRLVQLFLKGQHLAFSILVTAQLKHPCKKGMEAVRRLECLKFTASENATTWDLCEWQSPLYL